MRLEVYLNARGERRFVGLLEERGGDILFEYDKRFLDSGIELSPFLLPLRPGVASDPKRTFDGLFGVFNDSLPDGWGLLLLDRLLRRSGLPLERITPLSRLSLVGSGGMGALEYEPVTPDPDPLPERIDLDGVAEEAWRTLNEDPLPVETLRTLMALNGSSCGARPKIMVRVSGDRRLIVPDAVAEPGCDPWLIKFPARHDDPAIGRMEYACSLAAKRAGIEMPETALFPGRDGAAYFGVRRFDREDGGKVHVHTACGLLHASHRYASLDYENLFRLGKSLTRNPEDVEKLVRLMAFNVRLGNQDDHSKNFSFLLDAKGRWRLAPAYDLTPSRGVGGGTDLHGQRQGAGHHGQGHDRRGLGRGRARPHGKGHPRAGRRGRSRAPGHPRGGFRLTEPRLPHSRTSASPPIRSRGPCRARGRLPGYRPASTRRETPHNAPYSLALCYQPPQHAGAPVEEAASPAALGGAYPGHTGKTLAPPLSMEAISSPCAAPPRMARRRPSPPGSARLPVRMLPRIPRKSGNGRHGPHRPGNRLFRIRRRCCGNSFGWL